MKLPKRQNRLRLLRNQIERLVSGAEELRRTADLLTRWRLASFAFFLLVAAFAGLTWGFGAGILFGMAAISPFLLLVRQHRRLRASLSRRNLYLDLKQRQLARMTLEWDHVPPPVPFEYSPDHPFARDLDLIGNRSLSRLVDLSITREGGIRLREWLLETEPSLFLTTERQTVVRELVPLSTFRDRLFVNALQASSVKVSDFGSEQGDGREAKYLSGKWSAGRLLKWLSIPSNASFLRRMFYILLILSPINIALLLGNLMGMLPPLWIVSWSVYSIVIISQSRKLEPLFRDAAYLNDSLRHLKSIFSDLENRRFSRQPGLRKLCAPLRLGTQGPSHQLKKASWIMTAVGLRLNPILAFGLNAFFPWDMFFALRLQAFKRNLSALLPEWLDVWFDLEALFSLANMAYLWPESTFPEVISPAPSAGVGTINGRKLEESNWPLFEAKNLGHPLILAEKRVGNDFVIQRAGQIAIITGSNMAGKSSFLRTLGVNSCLAMAGGPVLADSLRLEPLRLAASITVIDSVTDGFSFFYAEVRRLKAILDEFQRPHSYPLFFLIDEIFRGTNNRERLIGSWSYVKHLAKAGHGAGVIATHDLELVKLADGRSAVTNYHFRDEVVGDQMVFDYKLHPGPCPTTNALEIMRLAGLPVDADEKLV